MKNLLINHVTTEFHVRFLSLYNVVPALRARHSESHAGNVNACCCCRREGGREGGAPALMLTVCDTLIIFINYCFSSHRFKSIRRKGTNLSGPFSDQSAGDLYVKLNISVSTCFSAAGGPERLSDS